MIESSIARRYAKALLEIGKEDSNMVQYLSSLQNFYEVIQQNPSLLATLSNRFLNMNSRIRIVEEISRQLELSEVIINFLKVLIKKGRIFLIGTIVESYKKFVYKIENKVEAIVTTAKPLKESHYDEILKIVSHMTGKKVSLDKKINPDVIGGISVEVEGKIYDGTIRKDLNKISQKMVHAVN